jgi:hypothetical protein
MDGGREMPGTRTNATSVKTAARQEESASWYGIRDTPSEEWPK